MIVGQAMLSARLPVLGARLPTPPRVPTDGLRHDADAERVSLEQLHGSFEGAGFRFRELLLALVSHESFRFVAPPQEGS